MRVRNQSGSLFAGAAIVLGVLLPGTTSTRDVEPATGSLTGRVTFDGGKAPAGVVVSDAVVYLVGEGLVEAAPDAPAAPAVLDQKDITFVPHVLPLVAGAEVEIRNSDAIMHNVNANGRENRPFNRSQLAGMKLRIKIPFPEIVPVKCDVHSQMSAYIAVVPNRFYAQPAADGSYTIANVPAGTYELVGWHEKYGAVTTQVEVLKGETITAVMNFGGQ